MVPVQAEALEGEQAREQADWAARDQERTQGENACVPAVELPLPSRRGYPVTRGVALNAGNQWLGNSVDPRMKNLGNAGHVSRALRISTRLFTRALKKARRRRVISGKAGFGILIMGCPREIGEL